MRRIRRPLAAAVALVTAAIAGGGLLPAAGADAQPNPYGTGTSGAAVTLDDRGGYRIVETFDQSLVRTFDLSLGGSVPDGVRLPDEGAHALPGILRPVIGPVVASLDGTPIDVRAVHTGHAVSIRAAVEDAAVGSHRAEFALTRRAATIVDGASAVTHVQPIGNGAVQLSRANGVIDEVRCVTYTPVTEPCGRRTSTGWEVLGDDRPAALGDGDPLTLQVSWRPGAAKVEPPTIDHR